MPIITPRSVDSILAVFNKTIKSLEDRQAYLNNENQRHLSTINSLQHTVALNEVEERRAEAVMIKLEDIVK